MIFVRLDYEGLLKKKVKYFSHGGPVPLAKQSPAAPKIEKLELEDEKQERSPQIREQKEGEEKGQEQEEEKGGRQQKEGKEQQGKIKGKEQQRKLKNEEWNEESYASMLNWGALLYGDH